MSRRKTGLTITIDHKDAGPLLDAFSELPREMKTAVRDASELIADTEATRLRSAAIADSKQSALIAPSITSKRADYPTIVAGGTGRIPGHDARYSDILFGAEFGGRKYRTTQQFRPHTGREGYWLFPTLRDDMDDIMATYGAAIAHAQEQAGMGSAD